MLRRPDFKFPFTTKYLSAFKSLDPFNVSHPCMSSTLHIFKCDSCFTFKARSHSAVITFTVIPHKIQNISKAQCCVCQVLAVCIIQWERVRGCRSSVVLFLYWLLSVVCSLVPLRAKIQLAVEQVREMTRTPNLGHPFRGPVLKLRKTARSRTPVYKPSHTNGCIYTYSTSIYAQRVRKTHMRACAHGCVLNMTHSRITFTGAFLWQPYLLFLFVMAGHMNT